MQSHIQPFTFLLFLIHTQSHRFAHTHSYPSLHTKTHIITHFSRIHKGTSTLCVSGVVFVNTDAFMDYIISRKIGIRMNKEIERG